MTAAMRPASVHCCCGMDPDPDTLQRCLRAGRDLGFTTDHCRAPGPECEGCPRSPQSPDGDPCTDCGAAPGACNCETYRRRRYGAHWEEET